MYQIIAIFAEYFMRFRHWLGIILLLLCLMAVSGPSGASDRYEPLKRFSQIMDLIERTYVEDVDRKQLIDGAIQGMLHRLDPHSAFLDKEDFEEMQVDTSGEFSGIGIEITMKNGRLTVVSPIEDTPAYEAGLKAGDIIVEINGNSTQDITIMEAVHKIRGPKGTEVELTILHKGAQTPEKVVVKRDTIPLISTKSEVLSPGYLYLRLTRFRENTTEELQKALKKNEDNLKGVILDLRTNPGGLLNQAVSVADTFLEQGKIVYTEGKVDRSQMSFSAKKQKSDIHVPLVVLINAGSASASEIVAGALKDHNRAILVGEKTFGKGSVQTVIPLSDGSGIKLTTALYYTPDGRSIQAEGITPDISIPFASAQEEKENGQQLWESIREEDLRRHLENGSKDLKDKPKISQQALDLLAKDNQLRMAFQLVKSLPRFKELEIN
jgi:carboxyl-terminal processing protease